MNLFWYWYALRAKPQSILTIEETRAVFSFFHRSHTATLRCAPAPYLLTPTGDITLPLMLRAFINEQRTKEALKPFQLLVIVPASLKDPGRCASQLAALLHSIALPALAITTDAQKPICLLTGKATASPLLIAGAVSALLLSAVVTLITLKSNTQNPSLTTEQILPSPPPLCAPPPKGLFGEQSCLTFCAALYAAQKHCVALWLKKSPEATTIRFLTKTPIECATCTALITATTPQQWKQRRPLYRAGFPPLYECHLKQATAICHVPVPLLSSCDAKTSLV